MLPEQVTLSENYEGLQVLHGSVIIIHNVDLPAGIRVWSWRVLQPSMSPAYALLLCALCIV
jgi:hypothetical protein